MKFIYVMDKASMKMLKKKGYHLLKTDVENCVWVFENRKETLFGLDFECPCVMSDILTF